MSKIAFLFPGQGAQQVGMGKDLQDSPAARSVFELAEKVSGLDLRTLCFEGPEDELARTDVCQVAIFTVSAALLEALRERLGAAGMAKIQPAFLAGLSLGEYTALYAAGAVRLGDAIRLVARRGQLMQQAALAVPSGMVALVGADEPKATELCQSASQGQVLVCANFNCPGQVVISGQIDACRRAEAMAKDFGVSNAVALKVAGAFHSEIMRPAARELEQALSAVAFAPPAAPVVSNVDALPHPSADSIRPRLLAQLVSPVRWQQSMESLLAQGVDKFIEIGPGKTLAGMMKRISRRTEVVSLNSQESLDRLVNELGKDNGHGG